jgi:hypothetical protein
MCKGSPKTRKKGKYKSSCQCILLSRLKTSVMLCHRGWERGGTSEGLPCPVVEEGSALTGRRDEECRGQWSKVALLPIRTQPLGIFTSPALSYLLQ